MTGPDGPTRGGTITPPAGGAESAIQGLGAYRPRRVVTNDEVIAHIDSTDEWIRTRSGIATRRFADEDETVAAMSVAAARDALAQAAVEPAQLDCVLVATVSHLLQTPAVATQIAHELGATPAVAFDISAACAGFCCGISLAADMIRAGTARHVLVIGVERLSDIVDRTDRSTAFIFADGAGAAVVGPSGEPGIGPVVWGADGGRFDLIRQERPWPVDPGPGVEPDPDSFKGAHVLRMEGNPVFRWASFEMAKVARRTLEVSGLTVDDIDLFVPHQANMRITDAMARALSLPPHVTIARDIAEQGNTSAASIPLALCRLVDDGEAHSGDLALLIGFGAGLVYAAQVVRVP